MSSINTLVSARHLLRKDLLRRRALLSTAQRYRAGVKAAARVLDLPEMATAQRVAAFLSFGTEIDTRPLIEALWRSGREVYLPKIHPFTPGNLLFLHYTPDTPLQFNKMKIGEPALDVRKVLPLDRLDIMVTPLLGFDSTGNRIGMGGGYYDRTLRLWQDYRYLPVGLALECQQAESIPVEPWDVPLPVIVTPDAVWRCG